MLTAGNRQNDSGSPVHRLLQGVIRGQVAGVEGDHHVHLLHSLKGGNVPMTKGKSLISILASKAAAMLYDILLKVQADDPHRISLQFLQIIIHGKGEV